MKRLRVNRHLRQRLVVAALVACAAVAGAFHKVARLPKSGPRPGESPTRLHPIPVANDPATPGGAVWDRWPASVWVVVAGVIAGLAALLYLKRRAGRSRSAAPPRAGGGQGEAAKFDSSDEVDGELIAQLRQYHQSRSEETNG